ncbi:hypothetical protein LJB93_01110 [Desulfovibrio sp. OttesenSCG-928-F07]|nr:hypothetical protein [Desulfovibrio sp. OttesenSCG-928-F07]
MCLLRDGAQNNAMLVVHVVLLGYVKKLFFGDSHYTAPRKGVKECHDARTYSFVS